MLQQGTKEGLKRHANCIVAEKLGSSSSTCSLLHVIYHLCCLLILKFFSYGTPLDIDVF